MMLSFDVIRVSRAKIRRKVDVAGIETVWIEWISVESSGEESGDFYAKEGQGEEENQRGQRVSGPVAIIPFIIAEIVLWYDSSILRGDNNQYIIHVFNILQLTYGVPAFIFRFREYILYFGFKIKIVIFHFSYMFIYGFNLI